MKIIALTGPAGSGKDTAAIILQLLTGSDKHPYTHAEDDHVNLSLMIQHIQSMCMYDHLNGHGGFCVTKFARPVYEIVSYLVQKPTQELMKPEFKNSVIARWNLTGRQLLQKVGTECFRQTISEQIWCDIMSDNLLYLSKSPGVIISDLRFVNEWSFLKSNYDHYPMGVSVIRLDGRSSGTPKTHSSESEMESIRPDFTVDNTGSYKDLAYQLSHICIQLGIQNCKYTFK